MSRPIAATATATAALLTSTRQLPRLDASSTFVLPRAAALDAAWPVADVALLVFHGSFDGQRRRKKHGPACELPI